MCSAKKGKWNSEVDELRYEAFQCVATDHFLEARRLFLKAIRISPLQSDFHWVGVLNLCLEDYQNAYTCFSGLLSEAPNDRVALHHLGLLAAACPLASLRNGTMALWLADKALKLSGLDYWRGLTVKAAAYAELAEFPSAIKFLEKAKAIAPEPFLSRLDARGQQYRVSIPYRLTGEDARVSIQESEFRCRKCGEPATLVEGFSILFGECINCWRNARFDE